MCTPHPLKLVSSYSTHALNHVAADDERRRSQHYFLSDASHITKFVCSFVCLSANFLSSSMSLVVCQVSNSVWVRKTNQQRLWVAVRSVWTKKAGKINSKKWTSAVGYFTNTGLDSVAVYLEKGKTFFCHSVSLEIEIEGKKYAKELFMCIISIYFNSLFAREG